MSLQLQKSYHQVFNVFQDDIVSFFWGAERTKGLYSVRWGDCFLTHLLHLRSCMHKAYRKILDVHIRRSPGGCGLIFCSVLQFISKAPMLGKVWRH